MILNEEFIAFSELSPEFAGPTRAAETKEVIWDADVEMCLLRPELIWQDYLTENTPEITETAEANPPAADKSGVADNATPSATAALEATPDVPPVSRPDLSPVTKADVGNRPPVIDYTVKAIEEAVLQDDEAEAGGPELAELLATRAELRRLEVRCLELESVRRTTGNTLARQQADFDNFRRRVAREREDYRQYTVCEIARQILPLLDNLTRALETQNKLAANNNEIRFMQGIALIARQIEEMLLGLGVRAVPSVGHPFDPQIHEAVALDNDTQLPSNTVTEELLRGYWLDERLIRAAIVRVAAKA